jgi:hypothetical protein
MGNSLFSSLQQAMPRWTKGKNGEVEQWWSGDRLMGYGKTQSNTPPLFCTTIHQSSCSNQSKE